MCIIKNLSTKTLLKNNFP